jgi:hypothetical protein
MRRLLAMKAVLVGLAMAGSWAGRVRGEEPGIWGEAIMRQPFDTAPFRTVRVPGWVQETTGCGYTLSGMDSKARAAAAAHGVTISELGFVDPFYPYYDSKLLKRRSPHVPLGRLERDIAEYQKLGVRILGVYPPCLQGEVYENHPDWRRIDTDTTVIPQIDMKKYPHGGMLCLLGPYGDFFIDVLAEILTMYPAVDAFSFDGLHYGGVCYCQHCRENYRNSNGAAIPRMDMNDPAFRRYQHWADRRMEDLVRRMQDRLKRIKPEVALMTWTTNAGRFGHFLSIPRNMPARMNLLLDAPDQEFWLDETNRGTTIVPAFANATIWAMTNHRTAFSEPYILSHGNPYGKDSFPPQEVIRRMLLTLTYGASPSIAVGQPPNLQQELYACLDEVKRRKPWLSHKTPEPWAALVLSDNTRNFYGRDPGRVEERYMAAVFGAFRAGVEEHRVVTVINDWNLNAADLARYKVLILANTACLDDAQADAVAQFVERGGGLVASLDASLFDEFGNPRPNFALARVFGVEHRGTIAATAPSQAGPIDENFARSISPDYWEKRKNVFDFKQDVGSFLNRGRMPTYVGASSVTFKGPAVRVEVKSPAARVVGTLRLKPSEGPSVAEVPGVVSHTYGHGRVVYFAGGFDAAYYLYAYPYQRLLLANAIDWVASAPQPVVVEAPMCVHSTVMRQTTGGSQRLIVHLYSDLNTTAFHAMPNDDVPLREEVVPIHDIRVTFAPGYRLRRVHLEPEGLDLKVEPTPRGPRVVVPRLDIHAMVVAELEPAASRADGRTSPQRASHSGLARLGLFAGPEDEIGDRRLAAGGAHQRGDLAPVVVRMAVELGQHVDQDAAILHAVEGSVDEDTLQVRFGQPSQKIVPRALHGREAGRQFLPLHVRGEDGRGSLVRWVDPVQPHQTRREEMTHQAQRLLVGLRGPSFLRDGIERLEHLAIGVLLVLEPASVLFDQRGEHRPLQGQDPDRSVTGESGSPPDVPSIHHIQAGDDAKDDPPGLALGRRVLPRDVLLAVGASFRILQDIAVAVRAGDGRLLVHLIRPILVLGVVHDPRILVIPVAPSGHGQVSSSAVIEAAWAARSTGGGTSTIVSRRRPACQ